MACPFFVPVAKLESGGWIHPSRLPLGAGWEGHCCAPGYEGTLPSESDLQEFCNLGYAMGCPRLPKERPCDAVRFGVARDGGARILLTCVCESGHRPADCGMLEYDVASRGWVSAHSDSRIQGLADCYLQSYLARTRRIAAQSEDVKG